jgi:hypothetical protein
MNDTIKSTLAILVIVGGILWASTTEHSDLKRMCSEPGAQVSDCRGL